MTLKKILSVVLGITALGLFSCASDQNNEDNTVISPEKSVRRTLTISTNADEQTSASAKSRSIVSLVDGNKWEDGDVFLAYNISEPHRVEQLTAKSTGNETTLTGDIECKDNDKIGVFYPYKLSYGSVQSKVHVSMLKGVVSKNHQVVEKEQDGTLETIKYFDYSYGTATVKAAQGGRTASGSVAMKKLYAVLHLDFTAGGAKLNNIKKLTLSNVIEEARFNVLTGQFEDLTMGAIAITPASSRSEFDVAVFPDQNFKPEFTVVTDEGKTYKFEVKTGLKVNGADYLPFTVAVKEFSPYVPINGVKWGKFNLQYTPGAKADGWNGGYHLAKNPWDYFYAARCSYPLTENVLREPLPSGDRNSVAFDHFRWGDIENAHNFSNEMAGNFWNTTQDLKGKVSADKKWGDIAYYASNGNWAIPTADDFNKLFNKTAEYIAYYKDDSGNIIYGAYFDPTVPDNLKGWIVDANRGKIRKINQSAGPISRANLYRELKKSDFDTGVFFPMAGSFEYSGEMEKPGSAGGYWLATANSGNAAQAAAFFIYVHQEGEVYPGYTKSSMLAKTNMYSIRPIYIGND
ncbi:MAG: hypothetical protein ACFN4M_10495 [Segatella salivae]